MKRRLLLFAIALAGLLVVAGARAITAPGPDALTQWREVGADLEQIDFTATPPLTDGFSNLQETEWPFFALVYYGYASCNLAQAGEGAGEDLNAKIRWALEKLQTPRVSGFVEAHFGAPFGPEFRRPSTLFHGHFLQLAMRYREVSKDTRYDALLHQIATAFERELARTPSGILPSYRALCWPSDTLPALAGLQRYDRAFGTHLAEEPIRHWVASMQAHYLDPNGLLCASIDPASETPTAGGRGVGLMMEMPFLAEVAPDLAREQYALVKKLLVGSVFGFTAIREYASNDEHPADIDSGEIIMGFGQGASGFGIGAAAAMGDEDLRTRLLQSKATALRTVARGDTVPLIGKAVLLFGQSYPLGK